MAQLNKTASFKDVKPSAGVPLDFSFKELVRLEDALYEEAESGCAANPPLHIDPENPDETPLPPPLPPRPNVELNSVAVRLSNNKLRTLVGLERLLEHLLEKPKQVRWLDLSCNRLESIDNVLLNYPALQVLYLHGNNITKLSEVLKLSHLPRLMKVTLHGNPIAELPMYRWYVPAHLSTLKCLDFRAITKVDRDRIETWKRGHMKRVSAREG